MQAQIIPLLVVKDVASNIEYLEKSLGFKLHRQADGGEFAVMIYQGALVMLQSQRLYASSRNISFEGVEPGRGMEILIRVRNIDEVYRAAADRGAVISRSLHSVAENNEFNIRRFSAALPDGYVMTFFDYVHAEFSL